jgi:phosphate uptake regulator
MRPGKITATLLTLAAVAAFPVSVFAQSANQTKIAQCNRIIEITNEAVRDAKRFTGDGQASDPKSLLLAANAMDSAAGRLQNLSIADARLRVYKSRFVRMYRQTSQATHAFVAAFEKKDRPTAEAVLTRLQQATSSEKPLIAEINNYCARQ